MHRTPEIAPRTTTARPDVRAAETLAGAARVRVSGLHARPRRPSQRDLVVASLVHCPRSTATGARHEHR
jgi:hypothetical protein